MNYEKIGKFIMERRKEINLTQKELADKLNITDRAVSRWERGIGCPDISLLEFLAQILNITVLELLHGEKIENENKVVVDMVKKSRKKINFWKYIVYAFLNILLIFLFWQCIYYYFLPKIIDLNASTDKVIITTNSMQSSLNIYDVALYNKNYDIEKIKSGDIIAMYYENENNPEKKFIIMHRVVKVIRDEQTKEISFITKGDNNIENDIDRVTKDTYLGRLVKIYPNMARKYYATDGVMPNVIFILFITSIISIILIDIVEMRKRVIIKFI